MRGTIKTWLVEKGYGFIRADGDGRDVFCHWSAVERRPGEPRVSLREGEPVEYEVGQDERGRIRAVAVIRLQ